MNLEALRGGGKNVPDGRDWYKGKGKSISQGKGVLTGRADPVRDGEVWLLGERAQGRLRVETERLLQTPW